MVFAGKIGGKLISTILQILLSRTLGSASYGLYTLGLSILKFGREIASLGLQGGIVRFGAAEHGRNETDSLKGTFISSIFVAVLSGTIVGGIGYLCSTWIARVVFSKPDLAPVLSVLSASLPFFVTLYILSRAARALHEMRYDVGMSALIQPLLNLVFVSAAFLLGYELGGALYAFLGSLVVSTGIGLYLLGRIFPALFSSLSPKYAPGRLLQYSIAVMGTSLAGLLLDQTDRIMLGILATSAEVGIYNAAALAATQIRFVLSSVNASFTPIISDLYHQDQYEELEHLYKTTTRWILGLSFPLCLVLIVFSIPVMRLFGPEFAAGNGALIILAFGFFIDGAVGAAGFMLQMSDHERIVMINNGVLALLNILLNLWLIAVLGPAGAALATSLSIALVNLAKLAEVWYLLGMHPYQLEQGKPFLAGLVAALVGWGIHTLLAPYWIGSWIVGIVVFGLVYLGSLLVLGLNETDRALLGSYVPLFAE